MIYLNYSLHLIWYNIYHNLMGVSLTLVKEKLLDTQMHQWETNIVQVPKLRTYCTFKRIFSVEPYVYKVVNRGHRSILAQFRNGILPLKIETGRYNPPNSGKQWVKFGQTVGEIRANSGGNSGK